MSRVRHRLRTVVPRMCCVRLSLMRSNGKVGRRRSSDVHVWVRWLTVVVGLAGVSLGTWGYRSFPRPLPWPNAAYGGLQLLALSTIEPPPGTLAPGLLVAGRFLAAAALASAGVLLAIRLSLRGRDRMMARMAKGHRVIVGSSELAKGLAIASLSHEAGWRQVVLVGDFLEPAVEATRRAGVRVVPHVKACLADALRGANEVVIAESDDVRAVAVAQEVHEALIHAPRRQEPTSENGGFADNASVGFAPGSQTRILLFVQSPELARTLGSRRDSGSEIVSLQDAAARELVSRAGDERFADHVVVAGDGPLATEVAVESVVPWLLHDRQIRVSLVHVGDAGWAEAALRRINSVAPRAIVTLQDCQPQSVSYTVLSLGTTHEVRSVFLVGIDRVPALDAALTMQPRFGDRTTIVALLGDGGTVPADPGVVGGATLEFCTWTDLLRSPHVTRPSLHMRIGRALVAARPQLGPVLRLGESDEPQRIETMVGLLLAGLQREGLELVRVERPNVSLERPTSPVGWSASWMKIQRQMVTALHPEATPELLSPLMGEIPQLLATLEYELRRVEPGGP